MNWETMEKIGIEFHKSQRGLRWAIHAGLVYNYLRDIILAKEGGDYLDNNSGWDDITEIAWGHDILKDIDGHVSCTVDGTTYEVDCSPGSLLIPTTDHFISEYLQNFNVSEKEKEGMKKELISVGKFHGLNAAAFLNKHGTTSFRVLTAILMHQCPVPSIYEVLPDDVRMFVDCTMLADKTARNYVRALILEQPVPLVLHTAIFGEDGTEFNYSTSLLIARIIGQGKDPTEIQKRSTKMFRDRCKRLGLFVPEKCKVKHLGTPHIVHVEGAKEALEKAYGKLENEIPEETEDKPGGDNEEGSEGTK